MDWLVQSSSQMLSLKIFLHLFNVILLFLYKLFVQIVRLYYLLELLYFHNLFFSCFPKIPFKKLQFDE